MEKKLRKISEDEFIEALHKFITSGCDTTPKEESVPRCIQYFGGSRDDESGAERVVTRAQLYSEMLKIDPSISSIVFNDLWEEFSRQGTYGLNLSIHQGYDNLYFVQNDRRLVLSNLRSKMGHWQSHSLKYQHYKGVGEKDNQEKQEDPLVVAVQGIEKRLSCIEGIKDQLSLTNEQLGEALSVFATVMKQQSEAEQQRLEQIELANHNLATRRKGQSMKERLAEAAMDTGTGVVSAFQEGLKIAGSQRTSKKVVEIFHNKLGHHIPGAETQIGQTVESVSIPALVHCMVGIFADKVPKAEFVQRTCLRAITGEAKDTGDQLLDLFLPVFNEIANMDTMDEVTRAFSDEETPSLQEGKQTDQLLNDLTSKIQNAAPGSEICISVKAPEANASEESTD